MTEGGVFNKGLKQPKMTKFEIHLNTTYKHYR